MCCVWIKSLQMCKKPAALYMPWNCCTHGALWTVLLCYDTFSATILPLTIVFMFCSTYESVSYGKAQRYGYPKQNVWDYWIQNEKYLYDFEKYLNDFFFFPNHRKLTHYYAVIFILHKELYFPAWLCIRRFITMICWGLISKLHHIICMWKKSSPKQITL